MYGPARTVVCLGQPVTAVPMPIKSARVLEKGRSTSSVMDKANSSTAIAPARKALRHAFSASAKAFAMLTESAGG